MAKSNGALIITLDFELYWGVFGHKILENYKNNLLGVRQVVPKLLDLFAEYHIHATWATVGFLFFESRQELLAALPQERPDYKNKNICPYRHMEQVGENEAEDPLHFAPSLIKVIQTYPYQEIGCHTFSHYFCLEKEQSPQAFRADLQAARQAARKFDVTLESLVFPKNQINGAYLPIMKEMGIKAYRGNELSWLYQGRSAEEENPFRRAVRGADALVNISGHNAYSREFIKRDFPFNIPSSRFLRPYVKKLEIIDFLKIGRILADLSYAAQNGLVYHLWWHPHNFGVNQAENLSYLRKILDHFKKLQDSFGIESLSMKDLSAQLLGEV